MKNLHFILEACGILLLGSASSLAADDQARAAAREWNSRLGRGINPGNMLEAPREGEWGPSLREEYFETIRKARFDSAPTTRPDENGESQYSPHRFHRADCCWLDVPPSSNRGRLNPLPDAQCDKPNVRIRGVA